MILPEEEDQQLPLMIQKDHQNRQSQAQNCMPDNQQKAGHFTIHQDCQSIQGQALNWPEEKEWVHSTIQQGHQSRGQTML